MIHNPEHYSTDHKETCHKDGFVMVPACHFNQLSTKLCAWRKLFCGHLSDEEVCGFDPRNLWQKMPKFIKLNFWFNDNFCLLTVEKEWKIVVNNKELLRSAKWVWRLADRTSNRTANETIELHTVNVCLLLLLTSSGAFLSGQCLAVHWATVVGETVHHYMNAHLMPPGRQTS